MNNNYNYSNYDSLYYIVKSNMPLVYKIVSHFEISNSEKPNLIKAGINGLIKAAVRYNIYDDKNFTTFATAFIIEGVIRVYNFNSSYNPPNLNENYNELEEEKVINNIISNTTVLKEKINKCLIEKLKQKIK